MELLVFVAFFIIIILFPLVLQRCFCVKFHIGVLILGVHAILTFVLLVGQRVRRTKGSLTFVAVRQI